MSFVIPILREKRLLMVKDKVVYVIKEMYGEECDDFLAVAETREIADAIVKDEESNGYPVKLEVIKTRLYTKMSEVYEPINPVGVLNE